jgi:hypothetical protein
MGKQTFVASFQGFFEEWTTHPGRRCALGPGCLVAGLSGRQNTFGNVNGSPVPATNAIDPAPSLTLPARGGSGGVSSSGIFLRE